MPGWREGEGRPLFSWQLQAFLSDLQRKVQIIPHGRAPGQLPIFLGSSKLLWLATQGGCSTPPHCFLCSCTLEMGLR